MSEEFEVELLRRWRSLTSLFNQVLTRIGEKRINDANDSCDSARVLRDEYPQTYDQLLSLYPWACATRRKDLAQKSGDNLTEYEYMFQIPTDCITVQALLDGETYEEIPFDCLIEGDALYCNTEDCAIRYTKRIESYELTALLAEALVLLLAHKVAWRITQSVDIEQDMYQRYMVALNDAVGAEGKGQAQQWNAKHPHKEWAELG